MALLPEDTPLPIGQPITDPDIRTSLSAWLDGYTIPSEDELFEVLERRDDPDSRLAWFATDRYLIGWATRLNHPNLIDQVYALGVSPDERSYNTTSSTPLHLAATYDLHAAADRLLQLGANLNVRDADGATPRDLASPSLRAEFDERGRLADAAFHRFKGGAFPSEWITAERVMLLLNCWPLEDPTSEVPRFAHLDVVCTNPVWTAETAVHKWDLVHSIGGLSNDEQAVLMGRELHSAILRLELRSRTPESRSET